MSDTESNTHGVAPPVGRIMVAAGIFDIALGGAFYAFNPFGLDAWLTAVVAGALVFSGGSVIVFGGWLDRRRAEARNGGRRRLVE